MLYRFGNGIHEIWKLSGGCMALYNMRPRCLQPWLNGELGQDRIQRGTDIRVEPGMADFDSR